MFSSVCALAVILSFNVHHPSGAYIYEMSEGYQKSWSKGFMRKHSECLNMVSYIDETPYMTISVRERLFVLALAAYETSFLNDTISPRGARGTMQTYRRYSPCGDCDLRIAGATHAIRLMREHGVCGGAARYNAGPRGQCDGLGSGYASRVVWLWERLSSFMGDEANNKY